MRANQPAKTVRPNVICLVTDDQGYADLGYNGNPWLQTPHLDQMASESAVFNDFHVQPLCTPTRGALLTGRNPLRNGAWGTAWGNSFLHPDERTMADYFQNAGYRTALFGKWHLGDQAPFRPWERGFETVVAHKGGGVGQTSDWWGNNYFDDTYFHNGIAHQHQGYCTDIWFDQAEQFIQQDRHQPFFIYLATNAPHSPYLVEQRWSAPYENNPEIPYPGFYGMITQLDQRLGSLRRVLAERNIAQNTILLFMTDNGTSGGCQCDQAGFVTHGYNAGMRGKKASYYDGGHRVACMLHYPAGGLNRSKSIDSLCCDIDILPTLADYCSLPNPTGAEPMDGRSLRPLFENGAAPDEERSICLHYHQGPGRPSRTQGVIMQGAWRLVHDTELYHVGKDPEQRHNIADEHPAVVSRLRKEAIEWWQTIASDHARPISIPLGRSSEPVHLDAMDLHGDIAWHQAMVARAVRCSGFWQVTIEQTGRYKFLLRRWPEQLDLTIDADLSPESIEQLVDANDLDEAGGHFAATSASITVAGSTVRTVLTNNTKEVTLEYHATVVGPTELTALFHHPDHGDHAAYYVTVEFLGA